MVFIDYIVAASKKIVAKKCECVFDKGRGPGTGHIKIRSEVFIDYIYYIVAARKKIGAKRCECVNI